MNEHCNKITHQKPLIHQHFSDCARHYPHKPAVICDKDMLTYGELDHLSNQLAHHLLQKKTKGPVGIAMERNLNLAIAIIGVLKAGKTYMPLDLSYPGERLAFFVKDSGMSSLLCLSKQLPVLKHLKIRCLCLDTNQKKIAQQPVSPPCVTVTGEHTAYIIYTSGSTGLPKGVCCHHKGVINLLADFQSRQPISVGDRGSWWTNLNFDVSVYEIFAPLTSGATLLMVPESIRVDPPALMNWLCKKNVTSAYLPPMMVADLENWIRHHPGQCTLKRLLVGVEPLPENLLNTIDAQVPHLRIINGYGPTETTVCATLYNVGPENPPHKTVPIGKPVRNMQIHLLDSQKKPVPDGETGEIWIGGTGVAHEYLNRPELTAKQFQPDPFSKDPTARLYRTGDMALKLSDGNFMFVGRGDFQVKFHGHRIELGEIEARLRQHPNIRETSVLLRENEPGLKQLTAYIVCKTKKSIPAGELKACLKIALPQYMIPSVYVFLDRMPATPNGKTDRNALPTPDPDTIKTQLNSVREVPASDLEKKLSAIFEKMLHIKGIGIHDNFFDLGGNSLLATRVCSAILHDLKTSLELIVFFQSPTVRGIAQKISLDRESLSAQPENLILPVQGERRQFPASYTQKGIWLMHQMDPRGMVYNIPLILTIKGALDSDCLQQAFDFMVERYEILRTSFTISNQKLIQKIHSQFSVDMPLRNLSHMTESEHNIQLKSILTEIGETPFDLGRLPLMKMVLVKIAQKNFKLIFCIHHILIDGWGIGIFFRELFTVYESLTRHEPILSSPPSFHYGEVVLWQQKKLMQETTASHMDYWMHQLREPRIPLNLFTAKPRPRVDSFKGERHPIILAREITEKLNILAQEENATLFMVLLAAFKGLLFSYSNETDIIVGATVANRNHPQLEKVIGPLINSMAMRTDLSGNPSFRKLLQRIRRTALEAYAHQDAPFEQVKKKLNAGQEGGALPIFRVLFILQNTPLPQLTLKDISCSYEEVGNKTAKVDILLNLEEKAGQLEGWFEYNQNLFAPNTVTQMVLDFKALLKHVSTDTEVALSELEKPIRSRLKKLYPAKMEKKFSAFIIGEGSLPRMCAEILLKKGCILYGMISPDAENRHWAKKNGICALGTQSDIKPLLQRTSFDYLFSIVNSYVVRPDILKIPRRYAINYHDAPLPRYAGMYATAWAIMNNENKHGISWHKMTESVDAGDILEQQMVTLDRHETSLTLNSKCYGAAIESFEILVDRLIKNKTILKPQNLNLRTYYKPYQKPQSAGIVMWEEDAKKIHAMVRALNFGPYDNPLCLPKLWVANQMFIMAETTPIEIGSKKPPGTIVMLDTNFLRVATGSGDLTIKSIKTMNGIPLTITQWAQNMGFVPGDHLPIVTKTLVQAFETYYIEICCHEEFWVQRLRKPSPLNLPMQRLKKTNGSTFRPRFLPISACNARTVLWPGKKEHNAISSLGAFAVFISRYCQAYEFDLGFRHPGISEQTSELSDCFAAYVPLPVQVDVNQTYSDFSKTFEKKCHQTIQGRTFLKDITSRYPVLGKNEYGENGYTFAVGLEIVDSFIGYCMAPGTDMVFVSSIKEKKCRIYYDATVLVLAQIQQLIHRFRIFLTVLTDAREDPIFSIPLLTAEEYRQQITTWNETNISLPQKPFVHQRFEILAKQMPKALAVIHGEEKITYGELNSQTNRLARILQHKGVKQDVPVGIFMKRSIHMISAILSILKAGGAYVPLDPRYPAHRTALMLKDSGVQTVLTEQILVTELEQFNIQVMAMENILNISINESSENLEHATRPGDLAYVIYTSGSTGTPKGVMVKHGGVANHVMAVTDQFEITHNDRVAQFFSITFDGAVEEIFMALTQGASLVLLPFAPLPSMGIFMEWVETAGITVLDLPSAFWHEWMHWLSDAKKPVPRKLRVVIVGGEQALESAFDTWIKHTKGQIRWFNTYGPTETTVISTLLEPNLDPCKKTENLLSIGRPIANTRIYVVDKHLQPVPVGIPGEMLIGGAGVARGYLNQPELTSQKFIPDPFQKKGTIYRTGDRVRYRQDGQIEFLGRLDSQVKIRGFRIEPGEVEVVLGRHPAVGQGAVTVKTNPQKEKFLVGYVVLRSGMSCKPLDILKFMKQNLPDYLVPAMVVQLKSLPRLSNGKVDRCSLPYPDLKTNDEKNKQMCQLTSFENDMKTVWKNVLGISSIGIHDNFFELGGHSLLAVRLCSELEKYLGRRFPVQNLFQAPSISKLCKTFFECRTKKNLHSLVEIQSGGLKPPLFLIHVLGSGLHFWKPMLPYLDKNQPIYGLSVHFSNENSPVTNRVEDLAAHYINEMRTLQPHGPYLLAGVSFGGMVAYEMARQLLIKEERPIFLGLLDTPAPDAIQFVSTTNRVSIHLKMFKKQGFSYVQKKLGWRIKRFRRFFEQTIANGKKIHVHYCEKIGCPLNAKQRDFKARWENQIAMNHYVPKPYDGHTVLFRSQERILGAGAQVDPKLGWGPLVGHDLDVIETPSSHLGMLQEPHVRFVGEKMKKLINRSLREFE
ncbi:amino acid adenylation domain-containing protein [Desulfocicer vacuolatum DSM 3385]|uniref:Amino acid adenylation domain-containing protein n=1 Tax=Desulfocicer vacuolatum DSM 3385 TaxID=1121400 RepID=A0A1W2CLY7_9BACT|nr:non-ribosomal peptide synthetase [Desulfocicer vacuolatum]SMC85658.1 amino acid adenylation domain-containing protein [Desulfocicer vacuolatum DSM 3385]